MSTEARKKAKMEYKQTEKPMGVYLVKNKINGKVLVGGSLNLDGIYNRHRFLLNYNMHQNKELQLEWKEHGQENFSFEILERLEQDDNIYRDYRDEVKTLEESWLEKLKPYGGRGYNKKPK